MVQKLAQIRDGRRDGNLVLPFELCPHRSEFLVCASGWANVVHHIQLNIVEGNVTLLSRAAVIKHDSSKNVPGLCRRDLREGNTTQKQPMMHLLKSRPTQLAQ